MTSSRATSSGALLRPGLRAAPLLLAVVAACSSSATADRDASTPGAPDSSRRDAHDASPKPASSSCDQSLADGTTPPRTTSFIYPRVPITPFYQWESNDGYCGETSLLQAGLASGQWISEFNARIVCGAQGNGHDAPVGTSLSQTGPDGFCKANKQTPDYNAQLALENPSVANAAQCLANFALRYQTYDYTTDNVGMSGYQSFMSWVKARVIAGDAVTVGILDQDDTDAQYDHIVSVVKIGTNHSRTDAAYYPDDVLYFDDHGGWTFEDGQSTGNPPIPPGAGSDTRGCTPYYFGYAFDALPATRAQANKDSANAYSIIIPGVADSVSYTGGDGVDPGPPVTGHNYGFAVSGPAVTGGDAPLPVTLSVASTSTGGKANPRDPIAGYNYENPYIGTSDSGDSCTNDPPSSWMSITLQVTVSGLSTGTSYRLYEYDFDTISGVGAQAALAVPTTAFNANGSQATHATSFVAEGATYTTTVTRTSNQTVVFRAVPADAP